MRDPIKYSNDKKDKVKEAIETSYSLIDGKKRQMHISNVTFDPTPDPDDYQKQKETLLNQKTWGSNIYADVTLLDKTTGKILDQKQKMKLGLLPTLTNRNSTINNGKEYVTFNQMRLHPGIYTKRDLNDQPTADFNLARGKNMKITYEPDKQRLMLGVKSTNVPLYTLLKDVYNKTDTELFTHFGALHKSESERHAKDSDKYLKSLHKVITQTEAGKILPKEQIVKDIKNALDRTVMNPEINKMTVQKAYDKVDADALITGAKKVLNIHKGLENPTNKDNLAFKSILSAEDFLHERLTKLAPQTKNEIKYKLDNAEKISHTGLARKINDHINSFYVKSDLSNYAMQINPMEFMENAHKITSLGEGAISDTNALPLAQRNIDISHMGFIDIVRTPDNMRAGVDVRASLQSYKDGNTLKTIGFDKTGKPIELTPKDLFDKIFAMEGEKSVGKNLYRAFYKGNMIEVPKEKIDYFLDPNHSFTVTTGSIPFANSNQGQRNAMGAKMQTQALALKHREAPLVTTISRKLFEDVYVPKAKVDGTVTNINKEIVEITDKDGKVHVHNIPHNFPLNYHSYLHVDPTVKVGQQVKKGDMLGDHNFSKDGKLALGVNMDVAYLPYKGLNNDDAFVITQQGADKLISLHTHSFDLNLDGGVVSDLGKFKASFPNKFSLTQLAKLNNSVVKKGELLHHGDPIILALRKKAESPEVLMVGKMTSRISSLWSDVSITWDKDYPGEVVDVVMTPSYIRVIVKAESPMEVASKISGLYGNKGVIGAIVPNHLAPRKADGSIPDVIMNPAAIPTRMNVAQVFETAIGKVLKEKKLDPMYIKNFSGENAWEKTKKLLDKHGVSETDKYIDPTTGKEISYYDPNKKKWTSEIFNGSQYIMKLFKEAETSYSARAGGAYDIDMRPLRGGEEGSKAIGNLDFYGLLAHGNSRNILKEMSTYKAEYNPEFWSALLQGKPLPAPRPTFAFNKFVTMMKGMGINLEKDGHTMKLLPYTDKDILKMSAGEIKDSGTAMMKPDPESGLPFRPETGGLFDPAKTGGLKGDRWTHIKLAVPVVNQMFEKPIRALTGLKQDDFRKITEGSKTINVNGKELTGGHAIQELLKPIDPQVKLKELTTQLANTKAVTKKDEIIKQLKYLKPLADNNLKPHEAYVMNYLPVIPPQFRPIYPKQSGELVISDANHLYKNIIDNNNLMGSPFIKSLDHSSPDYQKLHKELHDSVKKLQGIDGVSDEIGDSSRDPKGFLKTIIGNNAKYGYFQSKLLSKVQDIVGRAAITPSNDLGIDELGIPESMAWKLYEPHVIGSMVKNGYTLDKASDEVAKRTQFAKNVLLSHMADKPVILNRAPTLHKFNMMAFKPKLVAGKHIKMCPLVNKGFNADYDGDTVLSSVFQRFIKVDNESQITYNNINIIEKGDNMIDNKIVTDSGLVNLKDFARIEDTKIVKGNVEEYLVPDGIEVLVLDNDSKLKWMKPEKYSIHKELNLFNVETHTHRTVQCTDNNSLVSLDDNLNLLPVPTELGVLIPVTNRPVFESNIDKIEIPKVKSESLKHVLKSHLELNYDVGHLIGCVVGDGWASLEKTDAKIGALCFASITKSLDAKWKNTLQQYFVETGDVHLSVVNNDHEFEGYECESNKVTWYSAGPIAPLFKEMLGHKAQNKHLPDFFLNSPIGFRKGLLAGLIDTDGTVYINSSGKRKDQPQNMISITTTSRRLAFEIVALSHSLGMIATVSPTKTPKGEECWVVFFPADSVRKIKETIVLFHNEKESILRQMQVKDGSFTTTNHIADTEREKFAPPLSTKRLEELKCLIGSPRIYKKGSDNELAKGVTEKDVPLLKKRKSMYAVLHRVLSNRLKGLKDETIHVRLNTMKDIFQLDLKYLETDSFWLSYRKWLYNSEIEWELIEKITPISDITEAYDLTIPPNYTMVTESGMVVWDSLNVHPVISPEAVKEAWNLLPSNNLFNPLNKNPMFLPDQEAVKGLYSITKPNQDKPIKKFKTVAELKKAHEQGKIGINDLVEVEELK